jgi:glycosyltransferase involved in cell wall biosynthesis
MTRVLMIAPTPFFSDRGCHVRIYEQARLLLERGINLTLLTYPLGRDLAEVPVIRVRSLIRYQFYQAGPSWRRLFLDAQVLGKALQLGGRDRPEIIHAHLHEGALIGAVLKQRFGVPLLFDYQGSLTGESIEHGFISERGPLRRIFKMIETWIDGRADLIVVSSEAMAPALRDRGLAVESLPDCVDLRRFATGPASPELAAKLGLPRDRPAAVFLGAMSAHQGPDIILHAARHIKAWKERVHFLLMGYPEEEYVNLSRALGVSDVVTFTGRVDYFAAPDYLRLGAVALAPKLSRTEGNGKVLNYMACGLPVVAFDLPVNREFLGDDAMWVSVSPDRGECGERLARGILALLKDSERAARLSQAGRARAEREFSLVRQGERLEAVYSSLLRTARAGAR